MGSARKNNPAYLYSRADGDDLIGQAGGLARLTPSVYFGDSSYRGNGVSNYMNQPQLNHFRVQVAEIRGDDNSSPRYSDSIFDLDTRNLYFGQTDISPAAANTICGGTYSSFPEGKTVAGLPVRLQQVSFRGFSPRSSSDEYTAFFLVSDPIQGYDAYATQTSLPDPLINSDYTLHKAGADTTYWSNNNWMQGEGDAVSDFEDRLIIGDPLRTEDDIEHSYSQLYRPNYYDTLGSNASAHANTPGYKQNTYNLRFDKTSLVTRQTAMNDGEAYAYGWNYALPFEASIASRWTFYIGKYLVEGDAGWTNPPEEAEFPESASDKIADHWDVKYHTKPIDDESVYVATDTEEVLAHPTFDEATKDAYRQKIMRRFKPEIGKIYGCLDGNNWTLIDLIGNGGDGVSISTIKRKYSKEIVQAGSDYSFEVNLIQGKYHIRGGWAHVFNKSVEITNVQGENINPLNGSNVKIWLRVYLDVGALSSQANPRDAVLKANYEYGLEPDPNPDDADPYVQWYLIAETAENYADEGAAGVPGAGNTPILQRTMGDIYDRNAPAPELWPETITQGDAFDVLQLDADNGPAKWYTLRAQTFWDD